MGSRDVLGYGRIRASALNLTIKTHRLSWMILFGKIESDKFVCHRCDNPPCSNPNHFFLDNSDNKENMRDRTAKGRTAIQLGVAHGRHKLTEQEVLAIRAKWSEGLNQPQIAILFNVTQPMVSLIVHRKNWTHI